MFTNAHRLLPPGPSIFSIVGKKPLPHLDYLMDIFYRYGGVAKLPNIALNAFLVNHVDTITYVLQTHNHNFNKEKFGYNRLGKFLGRGLLTNKGQDWKNRRQLLQPFFHRHTLEQSIPAIVKQTHLMIDEWQVKYIQQNKKFNLTDEMLKLLLQISAKALFSKTLGEKTSEIIKWITKGHRAATSSAILSPFAPTFNNIQFYSALRKFEEFAKFLIDERKQNPIEQTDLLTLLLQAKDEETGEGLSEEAIIDEIKTFLATGHETGGYALAWTWWNLIHHPHILEKAKQEVASVLGDRPATSEDVNRLDYTRRVIEETMRLYPPIWVIPRKSERAFKVQDYTLPAKSNIFICSYTLHRHPLYWPKPNVFDPDRFLPENAALRPKFAYLPFGAGPRVCIAGSFAMLKLPLILATLLQKITLENKTKKTPRPDPRFSLRMNRPFWVTAQII
jgi:cytochrome P450